MRVNLISRMMATFLFFVSFTAYAQGLVFAVIPHSTSDENFIAAWEAMSGLAEKEGNNELHKDKNGEFFFSKFELLVNGALGDGLYFDSRMDYHVTLQEAYPAWLYFGYDIADNTELQFGVVNQPLGAGVDGAYYDFSFLSDAPLWLGLAHNPNMGMKAIDKKDSWTLVGGFAKNPELKGSDPNGRFRPDLISQGVIQPKNVVDDLSFDASIETLNTLSLSAAYMFEFSKKSIQLGANGQFGQLYNTGF